MTNAGLVRKGFPVPLAFSVIAWTACSGGSGAMQVDGGNVDDVDTATNGGTRGSGGDASGGGTAGSTATGGRVGKPDGGTGEGGAPTDAPVGSGRLQVEPGTIGFGTAPIGSSAAVRFVDVRNVGDAFVAAPTISVSGAHGSDFSVVSIDCNRVLGVSDRCSLSVTFKPSAAGSRQATLTVTGKPGDTHQVTLAGTGLSAIALSADPPRWNFGGVVTGQYREQEFVVRNAAGAPTTGVLTAQFSGAADGYSIQKNTCNRTVSPNSTCRITVRFAPTAATVHSATLEINGNPGGTLPIAVSGIGVAQSLLTIAPANHDFGVVGVSVSQTFTVTATGDTGPISVSIPVGFRTESDACSGVKLMSSKSCTIVIAPSPGSLPAGPIDGTLHVVSSPGGSAVATLRATLLPVAGSALIGYWPFDGSTQDVSGAGLHGQHVQGANLGAVDAPATFVKGRKGQAVRLNGVNQWIRVNDAPALEIAGKNGALSMIAWVRPSLVDTHQTVLMRPISNRKARNWQYVMTWTAGMLRASVMSESSQVDASASWHHYASVYDGLLLRIYVDGVEAGTSFMSFSPLPLPVDDTTPLLIGAGNYFDDSTVQNFCDCEIDELRLYGRALSQGEVMSDMQQAK